MSRDKLILFGVLVLALLGVLVYKQAKRDESLGHPAEAAAELPSLSVPGDVDKISVTNGDKPEVIIEAEADPKAPSTGDAGPAKIWMVTKPLRADANQQGLKDLVANLVDLKVAARVNLRLDDDTRKEKQLDAAHGVHIVAWRGGEKKLDATFGKSGAAGELAVLGDKPNDVLAIKGYSSYLYTKDAKDFRNKDVFHFDDANVFEATVTNAHGTEIFTKGGDGKWTGTFNKKPIERFDAEKVKDMLRAYKMLTADDFGDGKSLAETGLDKPDAEVSFRLTGEPAPAELGVGKVSTGTDRWAKRGSDGSIYAVTSYAADWLLSDIAKYQSPSDAGAPDAAKPGKKK